MKELMQMRIWICWKYCQSRGEMKKVPFSTDGGETGVDEAHRDTWSTYEEAQLAVEEKHFDGIGCVLPENYFLLDIDDRAMDDPQTKELLDLFNTYTETSVGGHGIHVMGKCDRSMVPTIINKKGEVKLNPDYYQKNPHNKVELYIGGLTNRFATYSRKVIRDLPVQDCTEAVLTTLNKHMRKPALKNKLAKSGYGMPEQEQKPMTQEELESETFNTIANLRKQKNGDKFIKLYDQGDISDYTSHSEADLALCSMIAFRVGNNPQLIDTIFRGSKLYREKWDRDNYSEPTIQKAIASCDGKFHHSIMGHPYFIVFNNKGTPALDPSLLAEYIRREVNYILVRDDAMQLTMIYVYENGYYHKVNKESFMTVIKKPVMEYDSQLVRMPKIVEVYNQLMTDPVTLTQDDLNTDETMINFKNGLLYVTPEKFDLRPHSPAILSTIQIPCDWPCGPTATPYFDEYLKQLTSGDETVISFLLQVGGVVISNVKGWRTKKALFLVGKGDTGKTVFRSLLEKLLGKENCVSIDLKTIEARFGTAMLHGKRLAGSSELGFAKVNEMNLFKSLTGGDTVFMEHKNERGFTSRFDGFLIFCMNRLPLFGGDNGKWVYERIMPVDCTNIIPEKQQDKMLIDKLYAEREGICYKLVMALQRFMANSFRFSEPKTVIAKREKYMSENNSVIGFFTECMIRKDDGKLSGRKTVSCIYQTYRDYCRENENGYIKTLKEFKSEIADYLGVNTDDMLGHNEDGTCFKLYDLSEEVYREYGPMIA